MGIRNYTNENNVIGIIRQIYQEIESIRANVKRRPRMAKRHPWILYRENTPLDPVSRKGIPESCLVTC